MRSAPKAAFAGMVIIALVCLAGAAPQAPATIRRVAVLGGASQIELEIASTEAVNPHVQVLASPERLVIDFPNASPAPGLHNINVGRGDVKDIRVGLFSSNPPVTRIVVDLAEPQSYQLFPSGKTLIVKLGGNEQTAASKPRLISVSTTIPAVELTKPAPPVQVEFENGLLSIHADKATMAEVLYEVHRKTGADIPIPTGADHHQGFADLAAAPPRDASNSLLTSTPVNFVMVGSERDPSQLRSVFLTPRSGGAAQPADYAPVAAEPDTSQSAAEPEPPPTPDPAETPAEQPVEADPPPPQQR
jgi:hypothetical protein